MPPRAAGSTPDYWDDACRHLSRRDRVLKKLIPRFGEARLQSRGDAFTTLARSIVGQQISVKAAQSVWDRFAGAVGGTPTRLAPPEVLRLPPTALRECGLSARKAEYLHDLARHFDDGRVHVAQWKGMDDEAIIDELVAIRGIGRWTAEMFLMFYLMRPNILPVDDLGLIRGTEKLYFKGRKCLDRKKMHAFGQRWQPWSTVATWYLWRALEAVPQD